MFQVNIFTLYPEFFPGLLDAGNYRRARVNKIWDFNIVNLREFTGSNQRADDKPFGGGSGMVIKAEVISKALNKYKNGFEKVLLSPRGLKLDQNLVENYKNKTGLNLICGHFEGVDQRVIDKENIKEISIGDYILTGGAILTWWVVPIMLIVGFLTPWPYNYWRLKKFGINCH